jgi:hypothetical protein
MAAVIVRNMSQPGKPMESPRKADGTLYRWAICFDSFEALAYSDSLGDLVAVLLGPSYADLSPDDQLAARIRYANSQQVWVQALMNANERFDISSATPEEYAVLMGSRDTQPALPEWSSQVPLVLLTTGYEPHTSVPQPQAVGKGDIIWLDPVSEESLLTTLHTVEAIQFATSDA